MLGLTENAKGKERKKMKENFNEYAILYGMFRVMHEMRLLIPTTRAPTWNISYSIALFRWNMIGCFYVRHCMCILGGE